MYSSEIEFSPFLGKSTLRKQLKLYKELIIYFSKKLNAIHNLNIKKKQWEILIGPTLIILIRKALYEGKVYRKGKINSVKIPNTFVDLNDLQKNDSDFNLIINNIVNSGIEKKQTIIQKKKFTLLKYIKCKLFFFKLFLNSNFYNLIIADVFNYEKNFFLSLKKKINGNILFKFHDYDFRNQIEFNEKKRIQLIENKFKSTEKKNIINLSYYYFPISIIERFKNYKNVSSKIISNQKKINKISTATGHIYNELFKFVIFNLNQKKNFFLYIWQHGANDLNLSSVTTLFNYNISNKILSWGDLQKKDRKFYKIGYQKNFEKKKYELQEIKRIDILFSDLSQNYSLVDININFYVYILHFFSKHIQKVQIRVILYNDKINKFNVEKIKYLKKRFKTIKFILHNGKLFEPEERNNSILIIPYHTTAIHEAFLQNAPFFIFLNDYIYDYDSSFKKIKKVLNSSKIGFSSLNEIKKIINKNDITWYRSNRRRKVIEILKKKYISELNIKNLERVHR